VPAQRIVITAGALGGLQLAAMALFDVGNEVLLPDPCYLCNRQIQARLGMTAAALPTDPATRYQPTAEQLAAA